MEQVFQIIERYGLSIVVAVGSCFFLYKIVMFVLVKKAEEFSKNHQETRAIVVKTSEKMNEVIKAHSETDSKIEDLAGNLDYLIKYLNKDSK